MTSSDLPPVTPAEDTSTRASRGRTRRSLIGLGGVIAGAVIGTAIVGTRAHAAPICFLRGTMIRTPDGERAIESLSAGDKVVTISGAAKPVKWIGRMSFARSAGRAEWVRDVVPVRVAKGAINGDLPRRDLYLSQTHSLFLDGVLVTAVSLVGAEGIAIAAPADSARLDYFHVELDRHDAIYAEGVPAETFREAGGNRESFDNFVEYERLHGAQERETEAFAPMTGFNGTRDRATSYIRSALSSVIDRRTTLDRIRDRLMERAGH